VTPVPNTNPAVLSSTSPSRVAPIKEVEDHNCGQSLPTSKRRSASPSVSSSRVSKLPRLEPASLNHTSLEISFLLGQYRASLNRANSLQALKNRELENAQRLRDHILSLVQPRHSVAYLNSELDPGLAALTERISELIRSWDGGWLEHELRIYEMGILNEPEVWPCNLSVNTPSEFYQCSSDPY